MKNKGNKIVALILILNMLLSLFIPGVAYAADVSHLANISGVNIYIDRGFGYQDFIIDGNRVPGTPNPKVNDGIKIEYKWSVSKDNLSQMKAGDEINFSLPTDYYNFADGPVGPLTNEAGEVLGTVQVINNKIRVVLNELAVSKDGLVNGKLSANGKISKSGRDEHIDIDGGIGLPPIDIEDHDPGDGEIGNGNLKPIGKFGWQEDNQNIIKWIVPINAGNATKKFNREPFETLKNAYLIDELEAPQVFESLSFETMVKSATSEGKMSILTMSGVGLGPINHMPAGNFFEQVNAPAGISLNDFKTTLKQRSEQVNKATYGVIDGRTIVVYFGDIPNKNTSIAYNGAHRSIWKDAADRMRNSGELTQAQYNRTVAHYDSGIENDLMQFTMNVTAKVPEGTPTQAIENKARLEWSDSKQIEAKDDVKYENHSGTVEGVEPKAIKIEKKDDEGKNLPGIIFKLQKLENGNYVDYTAPDGGTLERPTDANGVVEFKRLHEGKYRIIEVSKLPQYGDAVYEPSNEFEIKESDTKGILFKVTNPILIDIPITKSWNHGNNPVDKQPMEVTFHLLQNGKDTHADGKKYSVKLTNPLWSHTFKNLPKNDTSGKPYVYTIREDDIPNYTGVVNGFNIENTYTAIDIEGKKVWDDEDNQDGIRPSEVTIKLFRNGQDTGLEEIAKAPDWKYKFEGIPKFDEDGKEYVYTVKEVPVAGYDGKVTGFNIKNTHIPEETKVKITKVWEDKNNQDKKRPDSVEVELVANGTATGQKITLNEANKWTHTWDKLAKNKDGVAIKYTVKENNVPEDYTAVITQAEDGTFTYTVENTYAPETVDVEGSKTWNDSDNAANKRPEEIKITLSANGNVKETITVTEADEWKWSFKGLPKYEAGELINYTITEEVVKYYTTKIDGFDVENTYINPAKVKFGIFKKLEGKELRANDFTFVLEGVSDNAKDIRLLAKNAADGKGAFNDLVLEEEGIYEFKLYERKGRDKKIVYDERVYEIVINVVLDAHNNLIAEVKVDGEIKTGSPIVVDFINYTTDTIIGGDKNKEETKLISVQGKEVWDSEESTPKSIEVILYADGVEHSRKVVTEAEGWVWEFTDLPSHKDGIEIKYTTEVSVLEEKDIIDDAVVPEIPDEVEITEPEEIDESVKENQDNQNEYGQNESSEKDTDSDEININEKDISNDNTEDSEEKI